MNEYQLIANKIKKADAILIGASNGLSITEGIHLFANNQSMHELFGDLQAKYGLQNLLQGMMGRWSSPEKLWGFWSRMIEHYCGTYQPSQVMQDLKAIIADKDYFIVTSNGEQHFELSGFDENKIYEVEGDWLHMCCSAHCCNDLVPSFDLSRKMGATESNGIVPSELIPHCAKCGAPMIPSMAAGVSSALSKQRFQHFLETYHNKNIVILELGIGARNQLIKAPLMNLTQQEPYATYITINLGEIYIAETIIEKSFGLDGYLSEILGMMRSACASSRSVYQWGIDTHN